MSRNTIRHELKILFFLWIVAALFFPAWAVYTYFHPPFCQGLKEFPESMAGVCRNLTFTHANLGFIPVLVMTMILKACVVCKKFGEK